MSRAATPPPLIPRAELFGLPNQAPPCLSPDGGWLAWAEPDQAEPHICLADPSLQHRIIIPTPGLRAENLQWLPWGGALLFSSETGAQEQTHIFLLSLDSRQLRDLTPYPEVRATLVACHDPAKAAILVAMNQRQVECADVYRIDLASGRAQLQYTNPGNIVGWHTDYAMRIRFGTAVAQDGSTEILFYHKGAWHPICRAAPDEEVGIVSYDEQTQELYLCSSIGRDTVALFNYNLSTGHIRKLAAHHGADVSDMLISPEGRVTAVAFEAGKQHWQVLAPQLSGEFERMNLISASKFLIIGSDAEEKIWLIRTEADTAPPRYLLWNRAQQMAQPLALTPDTLHNYRFVPTHPITLTARDGLPIPCYLTRPTGFGQRLPLVVLLHGGPWSRDSWGFTPEVQWLANRGYQVLQVNYRGSRGFGRTHLHAGDRQWGRAMQNDIDDAIAAVVAKGKVDEQRIAVMGTSYGGFAALLAALEHGDHIACAVAHSAPTDLPAMLQNLPPYWQSVAGVLHSRIGNPADPNDHAYLHSASPIARLSSRMAPVLLAQGEHDTRVPLATTLAFVEAARSLGGSVSYLTYPDDGHEFHSHASRLHYYAQVEQFLATHLGGRCEEEPLFDRAL